MLSRTYVAVQCSSRRSAESRVEVDGEGALAVERRASAGLLRGDRWVVRVCGSLVELLC